MHMPACCLLGAVLRLQIRVGHRRRRLLPVQLSHQWPWGCVCTTPLCQRDIRCLGRLLPLLLLVLLLLLLLLRLPLQLG
jgi:hypothetical protein